MSLPQLPETMDLNGIPVLVTTPEEATGMVLDLAAEQVGVGIRLVNAHSFSVAGTTPAYRALLREGGLNLPDGSPVAWLQRACGAEQARQVRGPGLFEDVLRAGQGLRHYFYGSTPQTLDAIAARLARELPELQVVGMWAPPVATAEELATAAVAERIAAAQPDIVWVGLGAPKQDFVADLLADQLSRPCLGVGAAFDFLGGTQKEAPALLRRHGLEWLYRLVSEPRRLWKRYLVGNTRFVLMAARILIGRRRARVPH